MRLSFYSCIVSTILLTHAYIASSISAAEGQIPGLKGAEEQYGTKAAEASSGGGAAGLMGAAMSAFGGGGSGDKASSPSSVPALLATLTSMGIDPSMMQKFMPQISTFLKEKYGVDISQYIGGGGSSTEGSTDSNTASNMMGQAMGMFGK